MAIREIILPGRVADWSKEEGKFVRREDAPTIISGEAVDIYKPEAATAHLFGRDKTDFLLLSYRPKVVDTSKYKGARDAIFTGTQQHGVSIRGIAGGLEKTGSTLEKVVYDGELRIIQELAKKNYSRQTFDFETLGMRDTLDIIADEYPEWYTSHTGRPWRDHKNRPSKEAFLEMVRPIANLPADQRVAAANEFFDKHWYKVSAYGNFNENGVGGFVARSAAYPYCRSSVWNGNHPELFGAITEFAGIIDSLFKETTPAAYGRQREFVDKIKPEWRVGDTSYTTLTYNRNFRTAAHRDAGDFREGFGNLFCFRNSLYKGAYTVFPEWGVGVDMADGDFMAMDVHEIHGNTPFEDIQEGYERLSLVCYAREDMDVCGTKEEEKLRVEFIKNYKAPDRKTGIWGGMWNSQEWEDFKKENGHGV